MGLVFGPQVEESVEETPRGVLGLSVESRAPALRDVLELAARGMVGRMPTDHYSGPRVVGPAESIKFTTVSEIWSASPPVALVRCGECGAAVAVTGNDPIDRLAEHADWHKRLSVRIGWASE